MDRFLLHTCCAPCSVAVVEELKDNFDLTVFFYNPNIYPEDEYLKRKKEVVKVCANWGVKMIDYDYDQENWQAAVTGLEKENEGGSRCLACIAFRIRTAAKFAGENKYDYFSSTLTSGRNKRAEVIFPIAENAAKDFLINFYAEDWKKGGRQERGRFLVNEFGIYRQNYCGCRYSLPGSSK